MERYRHEGKLKGEIVKRIGGDNKDGKSCQGECIVQVPLPIDEDGDHEENDHDGRPDDGDAQSGDERVEDDDENRE